MTISDIVSVINGKLINGGKTDYKIKGIKIDTRMIEEGDLFIAINGANLDGHDFIEDAVKKGAIAVVVDKDIVADIPVVKVENTLSILMELGHYFRLLYNDKPLIAITGSVGKTMTKELIGAILETKYKILKSEKNYNNHIGLPLTLFKMSDDYEMIVVELGMNHLKEISKLSMMCKPDISVITNIGTAHIGNLGSKKNIFKAKMEIVDGMKDGILVLNGRDNYLKKAKNSNNEVIKCGSHILKPFDIILLDDKTRFKLKIDGKIYEFECPVTGDKLIDNIILAIQVGLLYNVEIEKIQDVLKSYVNLENRLNLYKNNVLEIIDDCYNASFESINNSLNVLNLRDGSKIVILGDVLELGNFSKKYHIKIGKLLKKIKNSLILLVGTEVKNIKIKGAKYFKNNYDLIDYLKAIDLNNRSILIKGSRRMRLEEVRDFLLAEFF